ncbi:MAG: helix-turn-helix domain-containing protein [Clostridiales bacterium]|nr:helix-turn-helix domain-containing protein [Clostridiales bacterium]
MNFRSLCSALSEFTPELWGSGRTIFFTECRMVYNLHQLESAQDELILLPVELVHNLLSLPAAAGYICIKRPDQSMPEGAVPDGVQILTVTSNLPLEILEQHIRKCLLAPYRYDEMKESLLDALAKGESLSQLLGRASQYMGNPLVIFDNNFDVLAHSIPDDMKIPEARRVADRRSANLDVLMKLRDTGDLGKIQNDETQPSMTDLPNGYQKMTCALSVGHRHIGVLCFYNYQKPFCPEDEELVDYVRKIACAYFQRGNFNHTDLWSPCEYFVNQLLNNDYTDAFVDQFKERLGLSFPSEITILLMSGAPSERKRKNVPTTLIAQMLRSWFPGDYVCVLEDCVLCLCATKKCDETARPELWTDICSFLKENRLFLGMSDSFSRLSRLKEYYMQADHALATGIACDPQNMVYHYRTYTLYHMIKDLADNGDIMRFCHPAIQALRRYDREYKTEYLECLRVYLECNGNIADCAQRYFMHYNSIKYRLKVIQSVCNVNLRDPNIFVQLYLSFKILEVEQKVESYEQSNLLGSKSLDATE